MLVILVACILLSKSLCNGFNHSHLLREAWTGFIASLYMKASFSERAKMTLCHVAFSRSAPFRSTNFMCSWAFGQWSGTVSNNIFPCRQLFQNTGPIISDQSKTTPFSTGLLFFSPPYMQLLHTHNLFASTWDAYRHISCYLLSKTDAGVTLMEPLWAFWPNDWCFIVMSEIWGLLLASLYSLSQHHQSSSCRAPMIRLIMKMCSGPGAGMSFI